MYLDAIRPVFPGIVPVLWLVKGFVPVYHKILFRKPNITGLPYHENTTSLTKRTFILTSPQLEKTCIAVGQPSTGHLNEGTREGLEDLWIRNYRV